MGIVDDARRAPRTAAPAPTRHLGVIAAEIINDWRPVYHEAAPYVSAMLRLSTIADHYGCDPASEVVARFLANASRWRGPTARRIKLELKTICMEYERRYR